MHRLHREVSISCDFIDKVRVDDMPKIGTYADVEVGITTGSNGYFTVPQGVVDMYQLHEYARPMVGRSVQVIGVDAKRGQGYISALP